MSLRRHLVFVLVGIAPAMGAAYPTTNFVVEAPTPQIAQQIGQAAEYYRRQKALDWLGYEMPAWPERCPIRVRVTMGGPGGATSFAFDRGQVLGQHMHIEGPLDRLVASVLPHEVTHTVFAFYFRHPVPRWADEGGAVLSEDDMEKNRHDMLVRQILNSPGRKIPLRRLFALKDYPHDVMVLYAEGFSVANYLVSASNRQTFLTFIGMGMSSNNWDNAVKTYYRYNSVEALEEAWLAHLRATRRQPTILAQNTTPGTTGDLTQRILVRNTVPPAQPLLPVATFRGQAPGPDQESERFGDPGRRPVMARPGYLPDYDPGATRPPSQVRGMQPLPAQDGWQPATTPTVSNPAIRLGTPEFVPMPPPEPVHQEQTMGSPVGYPQ